MNARAVIETGPLQERLGYTFAQRTLLEQAVNNERFHGAQTADGHDPGSGRVARYPLTYRAATPWLRRHASATGRSSTEQPSPARPQRLRRSLFDWSVSQACGLAYSER